MARNKLFISYSHEDERWLKRVRQQLGVLVREGLIDTFDDTQIGAGKHWLDRLDHEMAEARIALLLISAPFLGSSFIQKEEIPRLIERHQSNGMELYPLLVRDCAWQVVPWLSRVQMRPPGPRAIANMRSGALDTCLADVAREIASIVQKEGSPQIVQKEGTPASALVIDAKVVGVVIKAPQHGEKLSPPISIKGTLEKPLPKDAQLWLFALGTKDGRDAYWPQQGAIVNSDRRWSVLYNSVSYQDGDRRRLQMFLVGKGGQALIESYRHTNAQVVPPGAPWPALMSITPDMVHACPTLEIFLARELSTDAVPDFSGVWQGMWLSVKTERGHHASLVIPEAHGPSFTASMTVTYERSGHQTVIEETLTGAIADRMLSLIGVGYKYVERGASSLYSLDNFSLKASDDGNTLSGTAVLRNGVRNITFRRITGRA